MAEDNPFAALAKKAGAKIEEPENPFQKLVPTASAPQGKPLTNFDRFAFQFIFDTQPERRKQFAKELGYELDPKDDNKLRPMGSVGPYDVEIDPGGFFNKAQYQKTGGASELGKDVIEGVLDFIQGSLIEGAGAAAAAPAGLVAAVTGGSAAPAVLASRAAGRSAAFQALENGKDFIGDMLLSKEVPPDQKIRAIQTGFQAIGPEVMTGAVKAGGKAVAGTLRATGAAIKNLLQVGGGKLDEFAYEQIKKRPAAFTMENIKKAGKLVDNTVNTLFGVGSEEQIPNKIVSGSLFQKKLSEIEPKRVLARNALSKDPAASFTLQEILDPLESAAKTLTAKKVRSEADEAELGWLNKKIAQLQSGYIPKGQKVNPDSVRVPFGDVDELVKTFQDDIYVKDQPWGRAVLQAVEGLPDRPGLNTLLKAKAEALGSDYAQIKAQESAVFDAFKAAKANISRDNARRLVVGGADEVDTVLGPTAAEMGIFNQGGAGAKQGGFTKAIKLLDESGVLPGAEKAFQEKQVQSKVYEAIVNPANTGSGRLIPALSAVGGAIATGNPALIAAAVGGAALSTPQLGIPAMTASLRAANAVEDRLAPLATRAVDSFVGRSASASQAPEMATSLRDTLLQEQKPEDPFADLIRR